MVFGEVLKLNWLHTTFWGNYLLTLIFGFLALICAFIIFPANAGIMMVSFVALLFLPSLDMILTKTAETLFKEKKTTLKGLYEQHKPIFKLFLAMFLAIFTVALLAALILPESFVQELFNPQLSVAGLTGQAFETSGAFDSIARNNLKVVFVTYFFSVIYGAGSIIMISWNASVWGAIFGYVFKKGMAISGQNPVLYMLTNLGPAIPHILLEISGYLLAAIGGGVLAMFVIHREVKSKKFLWMLTDSFFLLTSGIMIIFLAALLEVLGL